MLDVLLQEMRAKLNELAQLEKTAKKAAIRVNPLYSTSEMRTARLALQFVVAAIEAAQKKSS